MENKKSKLGYLWAWVKIAFICIAFFSLMFLQVFQSQKVHIIKEKIEEEKKEIVKISLELADVRLEIENIRNSDIINNIAENKLGMIKVDRSKYKVINTKN